MTLREDTIAKLQHLPEPLLQQVNDFIDFLARTRQTSPTSRNNQTEVSTAWTQWFESVDRLEIASPESVPDYQQLLLTKYRQQGLDL